MTHFLTPAAWNGIGIVSFLIIGVAGLIIALFRGWLVLGVHHREIVAQNEREITALEGRSAEDAESIAKFADAAKTAAVAAEFQQAVMTAVRQLAEERTG